MSLPIILRSYAADFDACGPSYAIMAHYLREAARRLEAYAALCPDPAPQSSPDPDSDLGGGAIGDIPGARQSFGEDD